MKKLLLLLIITSTTWANNLVSAPTSLTFGIVHAGQIPHNQNLTLTGGGSGLTSGTCTGNSVMCSDLFVSFDSTTLPTTAHVLFQGANISDVNSPAAGTYTAQFVITATSGCTTNCTATIGLTLNITAAYTVTFTNIFNTFSGCSTSGTPYQDNEICPIPNVTPGSISTPPALGAQQIDPQYGSTITRVASNRILNTDFVQSNLNGPYIITSSGDGYIYFTKTDGSGDAFTHFSPPCQSNAFDPSDPTGLTFFCFGNTGSPTVLKVTMLLGGGGGACGGQCNVQTWITYSGNATKLNNGGDGGISKDLFWAASVEGGTDHKILSIDLKNQTYTALDISSLMAFDGPMINRSGECGVGTYTSAPFCPNRFTIVSRGVDKISNARYIIVGSYVGSNWQFKQTAGGALVEDTTNSVNGAWPLNPGSCVRGHQCKVQPTVAGDCGGVDNASDCRNAQHQDMIEVNGEEYAAFPNSTGYLSSNFLNADLFKLNVGPALLDTPIDFGGGLVDTFAINHANGDVHMGAAVYAPALQVNSDTDPAITSARITTCANSGANIVCNTAVDATALNGIALKIAGATGNCTNVNGTFAGGSVTANATTITLASIQCSPAGTTDANKATAIANVTPTPQGHQNRVWLYDFAKLASKAYRVIFILNHRDQAISDWFNFNAGVGLYYGQAQGSVDPFGTKFCWHSNWGVPENYNAYCAPTGYAPGGTFNSGKIVTSGKVVKQ